jgi:type II secretory pathway pseudopilin PulG
VLIAVLIVVVVLSLVAYRFTDSMSAQRRASQRSADAVQARAAAVSGVHAAAAWLADPETNIDYFGGDPTQDNENFNDVVVWEDPSNPQRKARFSVVSVVPDSQGGFAPRYAATDEGGKLNINAMMLHDPTGVALYNALLEIPNMTPEIAANIVDWVDDIPEAGQASGGAAPGAESEFYAGLGYQAKNGPLNTLDELLLVSGVTPQLLYGTDQNQNGVADEGEGGLDRGWSAYLTVYGRELSVDSNGLLKIWINGDTSADELRAIYAAMLDNGIEKEMAAFIVGVKLFGRRNLLEVGTPPPAPKPSGKDGKDAGPPPAPEVLTTEQFIELVETRLESATANGQAVNSVAELIDSYLVVAAASAKRGARVFNSPLNNPERMAQLLAPLLDKIAPKEEVELIPRLNVGTAPREVIAGLKGVGLEDADVDAIMSARDGLTQADLGNTAAWLVASAGLAPQKFRAIEKYVTGTSMIYRVQVVGYVSGGGPMARVEAVIDTNLGSPRIVYFRDLGELDNPRGFPHPDAQQTGQRP